MEYTQSDQSLPRSHVQSLVENKGTYKHFLHRTHVKRPSLSGGVGERGGASC